MVRPSTFFAKKRRIFLPSKKSTSCRFSFFPVGSFCSRSECEKRKAIWDACVMKIKQDPGQKTDFDAQMLALAGQMGQYTQTN